MTARTLKERLELAALKKALEWELNLESRDIRSHAWYHGQLPRQRAEEMVINPGYFLIRDCISQPDNYVLTCRSKIAVLHFVINKILLQPKTVYERMQYQFEDDAFDTVADLITYYVGSGKTISSASGVRIKFPCNRTYPLSFYGYKINGNPLHTQMLTGINSVGFLNSPLGNDIGYKLSLNETQEVSETQQNQRTISSPSRIKRALILQAEKQKNNSRHFEGELTVDTNIPVALRSEIFKGSTIVHQELLKKCETTCFDANKQSFWKPFRSNEMRSIGSKTIARTNMGEITDHFQFTTHSLPRPTTKMIRFNHSEILAHPNKPSFLLAQPMQSNDCTSKPLNVILASGIENNIHFELMQNTLHDPCNNANGSKYGNIFEDNLSISTPGELNESSQQRGVIIVNPRFITNSTSSMALKSLKDITAFAGEEKLFTLNIPEIELESKFDVENYNTLLLPSVDNKPLDSEALSTFKAMLLKNCSKVISEHITRIDMSLLIGKCRDKESHVAECTGLEIMTLPHGKIFRKDLIERTQCIKLLVAVTILTCQTDFDRAELLNKWIQIAVDIKTALGNLFGFSGIMLGICMPQIQKLYQAWHILRQKFTENAFVFESKLRPTLNSMNECTNPQAPNTTIPHVLPYILLKDRLKDINNASEKSSLYNTCITSWERKAEDFGMFINFQHLNAARNFLKHIDSYRKNGEMLLEDANWYHDELLSDAFRTEFHVKFLWGSTCADATPEDRHSKLEKVLEIMADKFCKID